LTVAPTALDELGRFRTPSAVRQRLHLVSWPSPSSRSPDGRGGRLGWENQSITNSNWTLARQKRRRPCRIHVRNQTFPTHRLCSALSASSLLQLLSNDVRSERSLVAFVICGGLEASRTVGTGNASMWALTAPPTGRDFQGRQQCSTRHGGATLVGLAFTRRHRLDRAGGAFPAASCACSNRSRYLILAFVDRHAGR